MNARRANMVFPFQGARDELDRLVNEFAGHLPGNGGRFGFVQFPAVNVWQSENELFAEAELPGVKAEDLDISVVGNELTIKGTRPAAEHKDTTFHRRERGEGTFARVIRLPIEVDGEKVQAALRDGVLTITLPKAEAVKPRKIVVNS